MKIYRHQQFAKGLVTALGIALVICLILATQLPGAYISLSVGAVLLVCLVLFYSLTIEVTEQTLSWHFGSGVFRKQVQVSDIEHAEVTKTTLTEGWGIHLTSRGWLYNVSGFRAVAIRLKSGKRFLLGTDEPERLVAFLQDTVVAD